MKVFVCGDTHGSFDIKKLSKKSWPEQKTLTKEDVLIQLGDFGAPWNSLQDEDDLEVLNYHASKRYTTAVVPGNHENYDILENLPEIEKWGGKVKELKVEKGSIYFLNKGEYYIINGKKILAIGGALSIDKYARVPYVSWWPQETLSKKEEDLALKNSEKDIDYVLTHTCPDRVMDNFIYNDFNIKNECPVSFFLNEIDKMTINKRKAWHFGHMHLDFRYGDFYCHYNRKPYELK